MTTIQHPQPPEAASQHALPDPGEQVPKLAWPTVGLFLASLTVFVVSTVAYIRGWVPAGVTIPINAAVTFTMFTVVHDSVHYAISSTRWVNGLVGRLAWLFVVPIFAWLAFGFIHIEHHRHSNDDENDPDAFASHTPLWQAPFRWALVEIFYGNYYFRRVRSRPKKEVAETALLATLSVAGLVVDRMLKHVSEIASATDLPVSADLQNGFGDDPETAAETIRLAAEAGAVGGSIEDATGRDDDPIYGLQHSTDRVRAAAEMVHALPFTFTLTARAENYLHGRPDLKDTIARLQAFQEAGADVLYAPGLATKEDIAAVVSSVDRPVNIVMGLQGVQLSLAELSSMGVKRISVGSSLTRAALGAFLRAAREMHDHGTFTFAEQAASMREVSAMFKKFSS